MCVAQSYKHLTLVLAACRSRALFIVSRKPRFRQPAFDTFPEGNIDDLSDRAGVDPHTYEDRSMSEGGRSQAEGGDGDEAGERTPRRHESMDR